MANTRATQAAEAAPAATILEEGVTSCRPGTGVAVAMIVYVGTAFAEGVVLADGSVDGVGSGLSRSRDEMRRDDDDDEDDPGCCCWEGWSCKAFTPEERAKIKAATSQADAGCRAMAG